MKFNNVFGKIFSPARSPTSSSGGTKESNVQNTQAAAKVDSNARLPSKNQEQMTMPPVRQQHAAAFFNSTVRWNIDAKFRKAGALKKNVQARERVLREQLEQVQKKFEAKSKLDPQARNMKLAAKEDATRIPKEDTGDEVWFDALSSFRKVNNDDTPSRASSVQSAVPGEAKIQDIGSALHVAVKENKIDDIREFATTHLKKIPENERLAWLRNLGADKAMSKSVKNGSPEAIEAWGEVVQLLPGNSKFAFLNARQDDTHDSIAINIFSNPHPEAMRAWGEVLELIPDHNQERSKLLLARRDHEKDIPALADLFERGSVETLNHFVELAEKHVWFANEDIHQVLLACGPKLMKGLTAGRDKVSGQGARDWVKVDGLKYVKPHGLSRNSEEIAKAYGNLVRLVPSKYRMDVFFPEDIWTVRPHGRGERRVSALRWDLDESKALNLARSITLLRALVPIMTPAERKAVLNEIRSHHAAKNMGTWINTHQYKKFKNSWPVVDAMLLDLKTVLKEK
jgi:hypothetical protein